MPEWIGWVTQPEAWMALLSLTILEIILGVDNIVFISVLVSRLPQEQRQKARLLGLGLAMGTRILLLLVISWVIGLDQAILFEVFDQPISAKDLILIFGGLFLIGKATHEIHASLEGPHESHSGGGTASLAVVLTQIALIDVVFSLDSVITAVGLAKRLPVMILAIIISIGVMMLSAKAIGQFVQRHPTVKMLALSFLILIGLALLGEGVQELTLFGTELGLEIPRGYIYFAMGFAVLVELLNLQIRGSQAVQLRKKGTAEDPLDEPSSPKDPAAATGPSR